jgi:hypothetical protein
MIFKPLYVAFYKVLLFYLQMYGLVLIQLYSKTAKLYSFFP